MKDQKQEIQALADGALAIYQKWISAEGVFDRDGFKQDMTNYVMGKPADFDALFTTLNLQDRDNPFKQKVQDIKISLKQEVDSKISKLASDLEILFKNVVTITFCFSLLKTTPNTIEKIKT